MKSKIRIAAALLLALLVSACHDDDDDDDGGMSLGNQAPSITFTAPLAPLTIEVGESVEIRWVADDPDDEATTSLTAAQLGASVFVELAVGVPEQDGAEQAIVWTPAAGMEGTYRIDAVVSDGTHATMASAPGTVGVGTIAPTASGGQAVTHGGNAGTTDTYPDGSFIVSGWLRSSDGPAVFDLGGPNELALTSQAQDAYVAKYAPDGGFLWARQTHAVPLPAPSGDVDSFAIPWDVIALPSGGCVLDVGFDGTVTVGLGTPQEATYSTPLGQERDLLLCFDSAGTLSWSRLVFEAPGGASSAYGSLAFASDDTFVVTAESYGERIFDLGGPNETILPDEDYGHLAAFEDDGNFLFAIAIAFSADGFVDEPVVHADERGIWVAGTFDGTITLAAGQPGETMLTSFGYEDDQFLARYDESGSLLWAHHVAGAPFDDDSEDVVVAGLVTDASESIYVLSGPVDEGNYLFGIGQANETALQVGEDEYVQVLARYDSSGELAWTRTLSGDYIGDNDLARGESLAAMDAGGVVVMAYFEEYIEVAGLRVEQELLPGLGTLFLARFDEDGDLAWALNDGGEDDSPEPLSLAPLSGDRVLLYGAVSAFQGSLELGTNESESTFIPNNGAGLSFRAIYNGDGSF